jgi:3D (Asp-Asp-Asp) domain-containing protein
LATFGASCYIIAREDDFWQNPTTCSSLTYQGTVYSGTTTNPPGLTGTFCTAFLKDTVIQGSGLAHNLAKIQRVSGSTPSNWVFTTTNNWTTSDLDIVDPVADNNRIAARATSVIPSLASSNTRYYVDLNTVGVLLANDSGQGIQGYRLDVFKGLGRTTGCATGWTNPILIGACSPATAACPKQHTE